MRSRQSDVSPSDRHEPPDRFIRQNSRKRFLRLLGGSERLVNLRG
ncbi:hypothetical protein RBSH_04984 [Rhodopirellula baltica SH28]|uniref:Uncharacterized protein n=1 Tax=Rhodopirellula baltica SH28 TaxID=993517 RepID=K5E297_RHOBT|nr:hypothetical protein RBSH_04984 [Rhodopirellula baltica SH28]